MPNDAKKITQAVILSAGLGTRLRPITDNIPKVMVPFLGKPLLEWHIERFRDYGVKEIFINLHYLSDAITGYFGDGEKFGVRMHYVLERPMILGTAGGIKDFDSVLGENFFVIYGDMFNEIDYGKMEAAYREKDGAIGMMVVGENDHPHDSDLAEVDPSLRFLKIYPKPHVSMPERWKSLDAVYIFNKKILGYIPAGVYYEIDHELLPDILTKSERFYGYETDDFVKDIGTMERYRFVENYLKEKHA